MNNKNVTIIASVLTLGVSGAVCNFGVVSIGTTALAMIVGIVLNLILKNKEKYGVNEPVTVTFTNTQTGTSFNIKPGE